MKKYLNSPREIIKVLKEGKLIFEDGSDSVFKLVDGIIVHVYDDYNDIGAQICLSNGARRRYYVQEGDPLTLEKGKLYKTRDGRKAFVSSTLVGACGSVENWDKILKWDDDGTCLDGVKETDIVEEWREER